MAPSSPATSNGSNTDLNGARGIREVAKEEATRVLEDMAGDVTGVVGVAAVEAAAMDATAKV
jgi:hypothetical protein